MTFFIILPLGLVFLLICGAMRLIGYLIMIVAAGWVIYMVGVELSPAISALAHWVRSSLPSWAETPIELTIVAMPFMAGILAHLHELKANKIAAAKDLEDQGRAHEEWLEQRRLKDQSRAAFDAMMKQTWNTWEGIEHVTNKMRQMEKDGSATWL